MFSNQAELVTTLKRQATKLLARVQRQKEPLLITERGRPAAYLVDVQTFQELHSRIQVLEGIARGEVAIRSGRVVSQAKAKKALRQWLR